MSISKQKSSKSRFGFTIIELLVVIVVIGILATIIMVAYTGIQKKARAATLQSDLRNAATQLEVDKINDGSYPESQEAANGGLGLKSSIGTNFTYIYGNVNNEYRLVADANDIAYYLTSEVNRPMKANTFAYAWGGASNEYSTSISPTSDGGYIAAGRTTSYSTGDIDVAIIKYAADGAVQWDRLWGGGGNESADSVIQTADGGYAITGYTYSYGAGNSDAFVAKYTSDGDLSWSTTWGGANYEYGESIVQADDGGYVITGRADSSGGAILVKFTDVGNFAWSKGWYGGATDYGYSLIKTSDGNYVTAGYTNSSGAGGYDAFIAKFSDDGTLLWDRTWGGAENEEARSVTETTDGSYVIVGNAYSFGTGNSDAFVAKFTTDGSLSWDSVWGGNGTEEVYSVDDVIDGGVVMAGRTNSTGAGENDVVLLRYSADGTILLKKTWGGSNSDYGRAIVQTDDGYAIIGHSVGFGAGSSDTLFVKYLYNGLMIGCSTSTCRTPSTSAIDPSVTPGDPSITANSISRTTSPQNANSSDPSATVTTILSP